MNGRIDFDRTFDVRLTEASFILDYAMLLVIVDIKVQKQPHVTPWDTDSKIHNLYYFSHSLKIISVFIEFELLAIKMSGDGFELFIHLIISFIQQ